jgi:hypothetical protein
MDIQQLQQIVAYQSSSTCALSLGFPPLTQNMKNDDICDLFGKEWNWARNLTLETDTTDFSSSAQNFDVVRGITECAKVTLSRELQEDIQFRLDLIPRCNSTLFTHDGAFPISKSFPQFFNKNISSAGLITKTLDGGYVQKVPMVTSLSSGALIDELYKDSWKTLKASNNYGSTINGFEKEEINEIVEFFATKLEI